MLKCNIMPSYTGNTQNTVRNGEREGCYIYCVGLT